MRQEGQLILLDALAGAAARLEAALSGLDSGEARREARRLAGLVLGCNAAGVIARERDSLSVAQKIHFDELVDRRAAGEPFAYIRGRREFFGLDLKVSPAVLVPRPETELLVDLALERLPADGEILDLGVGSGAVALALASARGDCRVVGVEASAEALAVAEENRRALGLDHVRFLAGHWFSPFAGRRFHVIVGNPPYIAAGDPCLAFLSHEPLGALASGPDGLADLREIVGVAGQHLLPGGWLLLEHGMDQGAACRDMLEEAGFTAVSTWHDLAQRPRVSGGRWGDGMEEIAT